MHLLQYLSAAQHATGVDGELLGPLFGKTVSYPGVPPRTFATAPHPVLCYSRLPLQPPPHLAAAPLDHPLPFLESTAACCFEQDARTPDGYGGFVEKTIQASHKHCLLDAETGTTINMFWESKDGTRCNLTESSLTAVINMAFKSAKVCLHSTPSPLIPHPNLEPPVITQHKSAAPIP
jgi:hypothetical protein